MNPKINRIDTGTDSEITPNRAITTLDQQRVPFSNVVRHYLARLSDTILIHAAIIAIFAVVRVSWFVSSSQRAFSDTADWATISSQSYASLGFWAGIKPPSIPFFWSLLLTNFDDNGRTALVFDCCMDGPRSHGRIDPHCTASEVGRVRSVPDPQSQPQHHSLGQNADERVVRHFIDCICCGRSNIRDKGANHIRSCLFPHSHNVVGFFERL